MIRSCRASICNSVLFLTALLAFGCDGGTVATSPCSDETTQCSDSCVDTKVDVANCGGCGVACAPGEVCSAGSCQFECASGRMLCAGSCVDTKADAANCGGCGVACASGEVCSAGSCQLECTDGTTKCSGTCVDTTSDVANCGGCGGLPNAGDHVCGASEQCTAGTCQCTPETELCGGTCVDTINDALNCGGCGNAPSSGDHVCDASQICSEGSCACAPDFADCDGLAVNACEYAVSEFASDSDNCGACNHQCTGSTSCDAGKCLDCKGVENGTGSAQMIEGGGVASAGPGTNGADPAQAFDGNLWSQFNAIEAGVEWLRYDYGAAPRAVIAYTLYSYGYSSEVNFSFQLEGSNDAVAWSPLDAHTTTLPINDPPKSYTFRNTTAYRYYRLLFTDVAGGFVRVQEIQLSDCR